MPIPAKGQPRWNGFGSIPRDQNHQFLSNFQNYFMTQDATASGAVQSPVSVTAAAVTTITVPAGAVIFQVYSSAALRISEQSSLNSTPPYFVIPATTLTQWPVMWPLGVDYEESADTSGLLYLIGDSVGCTVQLAFFCI